MEQEKLLRELTSLHVDDPLFINWQGLKNEPPSIEPERLAEAEEAAKTKFGQFQPSWFDKIVGYRRKIEKLQAGIPKAVARDTKTYTEAMAAYNEHFKTWAALQEISTGVLALESVAFREAIEYFRVFDDQEGIGKGLFFVMNEGRVTVDIRAADTNIFPNQIYSKTAAGKLSRKNMPHSKMNKLYQDHVCSAVLRVARDLLALLPLKGLVVNATSNRLNSATGNWEDQVLVSVMFDPGSLDDINFTAIDPSDAMENFLHRMRFTQSGGFAAVEAIDIETVRQMGRCKKGH